MATVRRPEPGRGDPGRNGRVNGGKVRWDLGQNCEIRSIHAPTLCFIGLRVSLHVTTPFGESTNDELLSKAGADPLCGTDCEIPKHKANAAIRSGKIEVRDAG